MSDSKLFISTLIIIFVNFFDIREFDPTVLGWAKNAMSLVFILMNWKVLSIIKDNDYRFINLATVSLCCVMLFSTYMNESSAYLYIIENDSSQDMQLRRTCLYVLRILMTLFFVEYIDREGKGSTFIRYFFNLYLAFVVIVDFEALFFFHEDASSYLNGNKFRISYSNLYIAILYLAITPFEEKKNKAVFCLLLILTVVMSLYVGCITTIFACIATYLLFFIVPIHKRKILYSPIFFILSLIICDVIFFMFVSYIMEIDVIKGFTVNVLHKDPTLTGRLIIYERLHEVLEKSPLWGFGFGNAYQVTHSLIGAPNAQNGIMNLYIEVGILGCLAFLLWMYSLLKRARKLQSNYPVIVFIYAFVFVSSVEITFDRYFIILCMLLILKDVGNAIPLFDIKFLFELIHSILETEDDEKTDKVINLR